MAIAELSKEEMRKLTGSPDSMRVTGHELADAFDRVKRDEARRGTIFTSPPIPGEKVPTEIFVLDTEATFYRSPGGDIHVARWRNGKPQGALEFRPNHLAPKQRP